jgi:hypothetical protein
MEQDEWLRIALAMGLMITGFILLPAFFLWKDKRQDAREAAAKREYQDLDSSDLADETNDSHNSYSETGHTR